MTDLSRASAPEDGIPRRTILAGAAWSIPVIATAAVAPAASASGTLALAFNQASYTGTACSTITGAYVTATDAGAPKAGVPITVSLSNGYTFSGGSTTATGFSDTNGRYALPAISVPAAGGSATASASTAGATVSASMTTLAGVFSQTGQKRTLPAGVTATQIWATTRNSDGLTRVYVLGSDKTLYQLDGNSVTQSFGSLGTTATNVTTFGIGEGDQSAISAYWATSDGKIYSQTGQKGTLPAGVTATRIWGTTRNSDHLTRVYILGDDKTLYQLDGNSVTQSFGGLGTTATNVTTFGIGEGDQSAISAYWATTDGKIYSQTGQKGTLPAGVTATQIWATTRNSDGLTRVYVLGSDKTLYQLDGNSVTQSFAARTTRDTNVAALGVGEGDQSAISAYYSTADGKIRNQNAALLGTLPTGITATKIWATTRNSDGLTRVYVLGSDKTLYQLDGNSVTQSFGSLGTTATNVTTFGIGEGDQSAISAYWATDGTKSSC